MILYCDHHSGMGLCESCSRAQRKAQFSADYDNRKTLERHAPLLKRAAEVLREAGEYSLAAQIEAKLGR